MDDLANPSTSYLDAFSDQGPHVAFDQLQARLRSALKLKDELADYFKERALIEDLYAKNLAKLNKKAFITDKSALGTMLPVWEKIHGELVDTSMIHGTFATKIVDQIETPLRSAIVNNQAYAEVRSMEPTFKKLAKDYVDCMEKSSKLTKKKSGAAEIKHAAIKEQIDGLKSEWQQNGSKYIQAFQRMDEYRWLNIKTHLQEFETLQNDQMLKRVQLAGEHLDSVCGFSVQEELVSFCSQYATNNINTSHTTSAQQPDEPTTRLPSSSQVTSVANNSNLTEPVSPTLSSTLEPSLLVDTADNHIIPQSTKSTESYASSRTTGRSAPILPPVAEDTDHGQFDINRTNITPSIKSNKKVNKQRKFLSSFSLRLKPKSSNGNQFGHQLFDVSESETDTQLYDNTMDHHPTQHDSTTSEPTNSSLITTLEPPTLHKTTSFADSFFNQSSSSFNQQNNNNNMKSIIPIDEEGFSVPPPDRTPWVASPTLGDDLSDLTDSSSYGTTPRIKLDIKNDPVIQEDAKTSQVVLTRVASILKENNPVGSKRPRGRRELRSGNRMSVYQTTGSPLSTTLVSSTALGDPIISPFDDDTSATPIISIRISETIHAQLRHGQAQRIMVTGDIAILYDSGHDYPANFILKHDDGVETTVSDNQIKQLETTDQGTIYQFTPNTTSHSDYTTCIQYRQTNLIPPLLVKPMWKCDDNQARLMIKYTKTNHDLDQVKMSTHVGGNCQGAQSMPTGQWLVDQQRMVWSLDDDDDNQVIRAKFATTTRADPQPIAIRFEIKNQRVSCVEVEQAPLVVPGAPWARINKVEQYTRSGKYLAEV